MLAIHTDAPYEPLGLVIGGNARAIIEQGAAAAGGRDCFHGWAEKQDTPACRDHHIVWGLDDVEIAALAQVLKDTGHQVVVTAPLTEDQFGDHEVADGLPQHYVDTHSH